MNSWIKTMNNWLVTIGMVVTMSSISNAEPMTKAQGDALLKELREIKQLLARPQQQMPTAPMAQARPENLSVKNSGATYVLGKSDAPLTMVEFTDYECPFCKRFYDTTFQTLKKNYIDTGKLKFISRNMPLPMHPHALKGAQAAMCAGEQGKYWEMKDALFENQNRLEMDALTAYASALMLNADTFKTCLSDEAHQKSIADEASYINSLGITGTPAFVLGKSVGDSVEGRKIVGAQPLEVFEGAINELLGKH